MRALSKSTPFDSLFLCPAVRSKNGNTTNRTKKSSHPKITASLKCGAGKEIATLAALAAWLESQSPGACGLASWILAHLTLRVLIPLPPTFQHNTKKKQPSEDNCFSQMWSGQRDSNSRLPPWQGGTLPLSYTRIWCLGAESNHRHGDFQSPALPTELPRRLWRRRWGSNPRPPA